MAVYAVRDAVGLRRYPEVEYALDQRPEDSRSSVAARRVYRCRRKPERGALRARQRLENHGGLWRGGRILADEEETVALSAQKLQEAASVRIAPAEKIELVHRDRVLDPSVTLSDAGFLALDRFDVREERPRGVS
jgi:hypothetical protein